MRLLPASLLALAWLALRDSLDGPVSLFPFLLGGAALLLLPVRALDVVAARRWPLGAVALRRLTIAVAVVAPLALAALWLGRKVLAPALWFAPVGMLLFAVVVVLIVDRPLSRVGLREEPVVWRGFVLAALLLCALFVWMHFEESTFARVRPGRLSLHYILFVGTWLVTLAALPPLALRLTLTSAPPRARASLLWAGLGVVMGAALIEGNLRLFPQEYEAVHVWLACVGALSLEAGLALLIVRLPLSASIARAAGAASAAMLIASIVFFGFSGVERGLLFRSCAVATAVGAPILDLRDSFAVSDDEGGTFAAVQTDDARAVRLDYARYHDSPGETPMNILLIVVDTLRADQIGPAGEPHAPRINALAKESTHFTRVYAQSTATVQSMAALMTGRPVGQLDWTLFVTPKSGERKFVKRDSLTPEQLEHLDEYRHQELPTMPNDGTLAERIRDAGRHTMAVPYANIATFFAPELGFARGFDVFPDLAGREEPLPMAMDVTSWALAQIDAAPKDRPWFQWVHYFDAHNARNALRYPKFVGWVDEGIGALLDGIKARGLADNTIVVLTADHGESFGEHRALTHSTSLYEEQVRVPLVVHIPGQRARTIDKPVALIDLTATLLALTGARSDDSIEGVNLLPLVLSGKAASARPIFFEIQTWWGRDGKRGKNLKGIVVDNWKLIHDRRRRVFELFDLATDPSEKNNLIGERPEEAARLSAALDAYFKAAEAAHPPLQGL